MMNQTDRLAKAQAEIAEIQKRYGVRLVVQSVVKKVDDGSVIVQPTLTIQADLEWQGRESVLES